MSEAIECQYWNLPTIRTFPRYQHFAGFILGARSKIKYLFPVALLVSFAAPASAAMMKCSGDNMAKSATMMQTMADGPGKMAMGKEMGMANMEMSKGNMRGACMHYMKAQKMGMMKSDGMKM